MRPLARFSIAVSLLLGCDSNGLPDTPDAPLDAPRDVPADVRPDAGPPVLELGPGSVEACPDWDVVDEITPRGLPADSTPRLLWVWTPSLDPGIPDRGAPGIGPNAVSRSPDGRLFVLLGGPVGRLVWLSSQGALRAVSDPLGRGVIGPPMALPDGSVGLLANWSGTGAFVALDEDGSRRVVNGGPSHLPGVGPNSWLEAAVGAHGMVYFLGWNWLAAACHGTERVWMLRFPNNVHDLRIDQDGTAWLRSWHGWAPVSRSGEVGAWQTGERCTNHVGDTAYCDEYVDGHTVFSARREGALVWSHRVATPYWSGLWDAEGLLWIEDSTLVRDGRRALRRVGPDGVVFDVAGHILGHHAYAPLADGSFFGENSFDSTDVGVRDPATGEERWRLEVPDPTSTGVITGVREMPVIGPDGVAYFAGGISVYAYQLDRLPPEEPYCLGAYCGNSRLDGAARRFPN